MADDNRKKNLLPSDEMYENMIVALKAQNHGSVPGVTAKQKHTWRKSYQLTVVDGVELVTDRSSNKRVLKESQLLNEIERIHALDKHSGSRATIKKLQVHSWASNFKIKN